MLNATLAKWEISNSGAHFRTSPSNPVCASIIPGAYANYWTVTLELPSLEHVVLAQGNSYTLEHAKMDADLVFGAVTIALENTKVSR